MSHAGNPVTPLILLIEDNPGDVLLVRESLREHGVRSELLVLSDGEKALHFVENLEERQQRGLSIAGGARFKPAEEKRTRRLEENAPRRPVPPHSGHRSQLL